MQQQVQQTQTLAPAVLLYDFQLDLEERLLLMRCLHLHIHCYIQLQQWENALELMGDDIGFSAFVAQHVSIYETNTAAAQTETVEKGGEAHEESEVDALYQLLSSLCSTRAKIYEAMQNRNKAVTFYSMALDIDPTMVEAFDRMAERRMLNHTEEEELMERLDFNPNFEWLGLIYQNRLEQYDSSQTKVEARVRLLAEAGLGDSTDVDISRAANFYYKSEYQNALKLTQKVLQRDPYSLGILPVHICCLVELGMKSQLFYSAHQLVQASPNKAVSWFAVASYYYLIQRYDVARRYYHKSTILDPFFVSAWIGFGHTFAQQDESDQAMTAYRTAARLFEGSHYPVLCMGMEYLRVNNMMLAEQFFRQALQLSPRDPLVHNELGVIHFKKGEYVSACDCFNTALELSGSNASSTWEPTYFNLGHAYRKLKKYPEALAAYGKAMLVSPSNPSVHSCLGLTEALNGRLDVAINHYHAALQLNPRDTLTSDLLTKTMVFSCNLST